MSETIDPTERLLFDEDFAPAKATEPPKRWRNKWRVVVNPDHIPADAILPVGEEYDDGDIWPTKEICEEKARQELQWDFEQLGYFADKWLGAFPVEEDQ